MILCKVHWVCLQCGQLINRIRIGGSGLKWCDSENGQVEGSC